MKESISSHKKFSPAVICFLLALVFILTGYTNSRNEGKNFTNNADTLKGKTRDSINSIDQGIMPEVKRMYEMSPSSTIGLSVGGAKDINNFRKNIENGFLPSNDDITYEGLFYDYYFETGDNNSKCNESFCPSYTFALSKNPINQKDEYFLSVGLNSNIKQSDFKRKKLNLVIVLDRSGSMGSKFNKYYYDRFTGKEGSIEFEKEDETNSKLEIAKKTIANIIDLLNPYDKFSFVTFDTEAELIIPMTEIDKMDLQNVKNGILSVGPRGSTFLSQGYKTAIKQYADIEVNKNEYENRIIMLTDEMPNVGETNETELQTMTRDAASKGIYTTIIGVGVDFNSTLTEFMSKVRGANYFSVHSSKEFKKRLNDEFDYMVTPLFFNIKMTLISEGFEIKNIYGSPEANESTGELLKVNTLFPSDKNNEETKGGIILVKLKKISSSTAIELKVTYEDREGKEYSNLKKTKVPLKKANYYENKGIRKAIVLSRYAELMKLWLSNEIVKDETASIGNKDDIVFVLNNGHRVILNKWERLSKNLFVPDEYKEVFEEFEKYYNAESTAIGDTTLDKEAKVLEGLINTN